MLWLYQRTMFGKLDNPENAKLKDLDFREMLTLVPIVICCFWIGLYPAPFFRILDKPITELVERLEAPKRPFAPRMAQDDARPGMDAEPAATAQDDARPVMDTEPAATAQDEGSAKMVNDEDADDLKRIAEASPR